MVNWGVQLWMFLKMNLPRHVVPRHDPLVLKRYPAPSAELEGIVARLDVAPSQ